MRRITASGRQLLMLAVLMMLLAALFRVWGIIGSPLVSAIFQRDPSRTFLSQVHRTTNRNLALSSIESGQSRTAIQAKVYFALAFGFGVVVIAPLLMREQRVGWQSALIFYAALLALHAFILFAERVDSTEVGWLIYEVTIAGLLLCSPVRTRFTTAASK